MFESIYKDLLYRIQTGGFWLRTILLCIAVFLIVNLTRAFFTFTNDGFPGEVYYDIIHSISLSSVWKDNLIFPWVWITHIFLHESFFHLLWNMLWLYWLGAIVEDLIGRRHAILIFFESAIVGGIFFILSASIFPWYKGIEVHAYGASAAVSGLLFAAATISPKYEVRLILIGNVQIKYLALVVLILDLLFASQNSNSGGHFAHVGGAFMGWLYITLLRSGIAMDSWLDWFSSIREKSNRKTSVRPIIKPFNTKINKETNHSSSIPKEEKLNKILDKIKTKGMDALTTDEKEFLENISKE
jgi:membrane associated rhomboid family serine protease